jgi:hypothetical protein
VSCQVSLASLMTDDFNYTPVIAVLFVFQKQRAAMRRIYARPSSSTRGGICANGSVWWDMYE